jgi:para-aminobenzoate synthetase component 1
VIRSFHSFPVKDKELIKQQMLSWGSRFNICCFMDNHEYSSAHHSFECLLGVGVQSSIEIKEDAIAAIANFYSTSNDWIFGHVNYDFEVGTGRPSSKHNDFVAFPDAFLFVPQVVIKLEENTLTIGVIRDDANSICNEILQQSTAVEKNGSSFEMKARMSRDEYLLSVNQLLGHIKRGDCYEINFCQEFFASDAVIDPLKIYQQLATLSPNPFSSYYRVDDKHLLCASPERYLKKTGDTIISQPIKGTWKRDNLDDEADDINRRLLSESAKDRSENVMVVDLVRNDLSKICEQGSVHVEELFGIYSFPQVYQMISTVAGTLRPDTNLPEILAATFPMGSMTGAPKKRVMELIEEYEKSKRGLFSGSVGYITPEKDFDFNVVIRSILYNETARYLSYQVGSAITGHSIAEDEYEECLLKAQAIQQVLTAAL